MVVLAHDGISLLNGFGMGESIEIGLGEVVKFRLQIRIY